MKSKWTWLPQRGTAQRERGIWRAVCLAVSGALCATSLAYAEFQNGSFESDYANWTVRHHTNPATIPTFPPATESDLGLTADAANNWNNPAIGYGIVSTDVVGNGSDAHAPGVSYPLFGLKSARVNYHGNANRASAITQTATMGVGDIDPADGKAHIRFAIAPVLENPGHDPDEQPYFFVEVRNLTKGTQLFHTFNFSNQAGIPWQTVGSYQFTNWQAIDIAPGAGVLDVGDQVQVTIIASGCGPSGHEGHVYVDSSAGFNTLPGPFVTGTGPQYTVAGAPIRYTYSYSNGGSSPMPNSVVTVVSPQENSATRKNLRVDPATVPGFCAVSTTGAVGNEIDTVTCQVGTLNPGNTGSFQLSFITPTPVTGPVNHGNYGIASASSPQLLGPLVQTNVTTSPLADLAVTVDDGVTATTWGQNLTYTVTVINQGPSNAPAGVLVQSTPPTTLTGLMWTCAASGGAVCPNANGTGAINETTAAALPTGGSLVYTVQATATGTGTGTITHSAKATVPGGTIDPDASNNTGADVDNVGPALQTLSLNKSGTGQGTVTSVLAGINCGTACSSQSNDFPSNSQVVLYATAPTGSIFAGWSGGGCSGTATSCTVTMDTAKSVTAAFAIPVNVTTAVIGGNGTVTPSNGVVQPVLAGGSASYTVTPNAGYAPVFTDNCGPGGAVTGGTLVGNTYTTNAVAQDCTVSISFSNTGVVTVTPAVGANGSITPNAPKSVSTGGSVSYVVTPNSGYAATTPGGTCTAGTWAGNVYTISPVSANCTVNFNFASALTVTGSIASGSGTITPASTSVTAGGQAQFTITPTTGYSAVIDAATTCPAGSWSGNVYTVPNVTVNCNVAARFDLNSYAVNATLGAGPGAVSPATQTVSHGSSAAITLTPTSAGYRARLAAGNTCVGSFNADNTVFTVAGVTASCTAVFDFVLGSPTAIPTLSEWGLLLLAMLLMLGFWLQQHGQGALARTMQRLLGR